MRDKKIMNDLYYFYLTFIGSRFKERLKAPHIKRLSRELMKMYRGDYQRLCVAMPPRHSKSAMITLAYPLWLISHNPDLKILIINAEASLSERFGIELRDVIKEYGEAFGLKLSDVKHSSTYIMFEDLEGNLFNGSIRLVGMGGSITGHDADYIIMDDPYKGFVDIVPTQLEKKYEFFKTIIEQRIEPHTRLIILHTKWSNDDIQGKLYTHQHNKYKWVSFPAILSDGTPLWKERYTIKELDEKRNSMGERLFEAIYQQRPLDETGDYFNIDHIFYDDPYDSNTSHIIGKVRSWDLAYTAEDENKSSDYTAGAYVYKNYKGEYILSDLVYGKFGEENINKIKSTAKMDTPNTPLLIETGTIGAAAGELYSVYKKRLDGYNVKQSLPIGSKVDRAFNLQQAILDGKFGITIYDDNLRGEILKQLRAFPYSEHDDIIDAIAYAIQYLEPINMKSDIGVSGLSKNKRKYFR